MSQRPEAVAIIGAGPYGLAAASSLARAGISARVFGHPMSFWRTMPERMLLRSRWEACHIGEPSGPLSLDAFEEATGASIARPVPLEDFIRYGHWYQERAVPDVDRRLVERVDPTEGRFSLQLQDGERIEAQRVVVAAGIGPFPFRPPEFDHLPRHLCSHTSEHEDLGSFRGKRVMVIGSGQSALETAALMSEAGANVEISLRANRVIWLSGGRVMKRLGRAAPLFYAPTDVGPAGMSRILAVPDLFRRFPRSVQNPMARRAIRPAGAAWLVSRTDNIQMALRSRVTSARVEGETLSLTMNDGRQRSVDHLLLGTGYRVDVRHYPFLSADLAAGLDKVNGYPVLSRGLESSTAGLHFLGAPAAWSFGPVMRFVSGTWYASEALTRRIVGRSPQRNGFSPKRSLNARRGRGHVERVSTPAVASGDADDNRDERIAS